MISGIMLLLILAVVLIPLSARDVEYPMVQALVYYPYLKNDVLAKSACTLTVNVGYSNIFVFDQDRTLVSDLELLSKTIGFRYGLHPRITFEFYLRSSLVYGGIMDGFIEGFHTLFGLQNGGREEYPKYMVNYSYKEYFSRHRSLYYLSQPVVGILGQIFESARVKVSARAALGIPLYAKAGFVSDKVFFTAGLITQLKSGHWSIDFSNYLSFFKTPDWLERDEIYNSNFFSQLTVSYKRLFGGTVYKNSPYRHGDLANRAWVIFLGYRLNNMMEILMVEEIPPSDTVSDVTFGFNIRIPVKNG